MRRNQRPRRYVKQPILMLLRPLFRYSLTRDAYVLRVFGSRLGPVLRPDRRARGAGGYAGPERRMAH